MGVAVANKSTFSGRVPFPHEHGAWLMMSVPMLAVLIGAGADPVRGVAMVLTAVSAFCAQYAAGLMLRGRNSAGAGLWLGAYAAVCAMGGALLIGVFGLTDLLWIGLPAVGITGWQLVRSRFARKRVDRSIAGELVAVAGLALTAPGAFVVATGTLSHTAIGLWGLYVLYFGSSVFFVKMNILAAQVKGALRFVDRMRLGGGLVFYHAVIAVNLVAFHALGAPAGKLLLLGFVPVFLRALIGWVRLSNGVPNLKRIGKIESLYTLWFSGCVAAALRAALI